MAGYGNVSRPQNRAELLSPTHDWDELGPHGAGYNIEAGNDVIKLDPGVTAVKG